MFNVLVFTVPAERMNSVIGTAVRTEAGQSISLPQSVQTVSGVVLFIGYMGVLWRG